MDIVSIVEGNKRAVAAHRISVNFNRIEMGKRAVRFLAYARSVRRDLMFADRKRAEVEPSIISPKGLSGK